MFFSRRRSGPDPLARVRLATLVLGGVLGLVGMRFDNSLLVSVAIGVVLVGFLLRLASRTDAEGDANDPSN
jgi:purine-cytosine permease-like protein